jgi:hypothetical protein
MSWAGEELKTADLGDKRRNQRLIKIVEDLSAMPIASVTQAARDKARDNPLLSKWGETLIFRGLKRRKFVEFSQGDRRGIKRRYKASMSFGGMCECRLLRY